MRALPEFAKIFRRKLINCVFCARFMFRIFKTAVYDEDYELLDKSERLRVDVLVDDLFEHGDVTGKPLGVGFFREKKFGGKRLFYLVYKHLSVILLVAISDKKAQQATINEIFLQLDKYKEYVVMRLREKIT